MSKLRISILISMSVALVTLTAHQGWAQICKAVPPAEEPVANDAAAARNAVGTRASFMFEHPPDYVIGADDILSVRFWRDETMTADVVVRPDGKITLPLINDIQAAGLTPIALCNAVTEAARKFLVQPPTVSVLVKEIKSRKVYITGQVGKPGQYEMSGPMTVVQLITVAGGLAEFADSKNITVLRSEAGKNLSYKVNYDDISKGKSLTQNIALKPGDTVIVR